MKKKLLICLFAALLCTGIFAGCGSTDSNNNSSQSSASSTAATSSSTSTASIETTEASYDNGIAIVKQNGHWRALELFGGGTGETFINAINTLRSDVSSNVKIYFMPIPQASEFYTPEEYKDYTASQKECFEAIAKQLNSGVTYVDADSVLAQHVDEDIYLRTDHHWQQLGAYYAAEAFAKAADVPFNSLDKYTKKETTGFVGTLYAETESSLLLNDPDTFVYYIPTTVTQASYYDQSFGYQYDGAIVYTKVGDNDLHSNEYMRFLGGDAYASKIVTNVDNNRKLLVIKDSYGNAEVPFYTGSFKEIYTIDMRYFECNLVDFINQMGITDVLFTCASYSVVGANAENLPTLLTQNAGATIVDGAKS